MFWKKRGQCDAKTTKKRFFVVLAFFGVPELLRIFFLFWRVFCKSSLDLSSFLFFFFFFFFFFFLIFKMWCVRIVGRSGAILSQNMLRSSSLSPSSSSSLLFRGTRSLSTQRPLLGFSFLLSFYFILQL